MQILEENKKDDKKQKELSDYLNELIDNVVNYTVKYVENNKDTDKLVDQVETVIKERYLITYQNGEKDENWSDVSRRVARTVASSMTLYFSDKYIDTIRKFENILYDMLYLRIFIFNSPALFSLGAGISKDYYKLDKVEYDDYKYIYKHLDKKNFTSSACFILDIDDSIEGIFDTMKNAGQISKAGGGIGFNIGELRPKFAHIKSSDSDSSGSVQFLRMYDSMGQVIKQGSKRRFAGMSVLLDSGDKFWEREVTLHPDIEEFYTAKKDNDGKSVLSVFNLSIGINNSKSLLEKYNNNEDIKYTFKGKDYIDIIDPKKKDWKFNTSINARDFIHDISENAWKSGDPGLLFFDKINKYNPFRDVLPMKASNPCFGYNERLLTDNGEYKIGELEGKKVRVWSPFEQEFVEADIFKTGEKETITLFLDNEETLTVTRDHLIYDYDRNDWEEAQNMLGRRVLLLENIPAIVINMKVNEVEPVYDFSMEKYHVGVVNGVVCHNCGERPGVSSSEYGIYDTCDLGHLDVNKFLFQKSDNIFDVEFDEDALLNSARLSYYFLDFLHDLMMYPIDEVKKGIIGLRSIGLGFYGLAGSLIRMDIPYNSEKARKFGYKIMKILETGTLHESYIAGELISPMMFNTVGNPKIYPSEIWYREKDGYEDIQYSKNVMNLFNKVKQFLENDVNNGVIARRNINTTTVAPTGTTSQIGFTPEWGDVGSGIEPIFSFHYERTITSKDNVDTKVEYFNVLADKILPNEVKHYFVENNENLNNIDYEHKDIFVSANNIGYLDHIKMQEAVQWCCSSAISKTINMPSDATVEDVENAYLEAAKSPVIKGITIFRDGSLSIQVLSQKKNNITEKKVSKNVSFFLDDMGKIRPRPRSDEMLAVVRKFKVDHTSYLTVSFDGEFNPIEIFLNNGAEIAEIIGRLSSMALRAGVSVDEIVEQLEKTNYKYSQTVAAEIKKAIERIKLLRGNIKNIDSIMCGDTTQEKFNLTKQIAEGSVIQKGEDYFDAKTGEIICPSCGHKNTIRKQEGCVMCSDCKWSACA